MLAFSFRAFQRDERAACFKKIKPGRCILLTFGGVVGEHGERGLLVGDAVAQTGTVGCDTGAAGVVHIELERRLCGEHKHTSTMN